MKNHTDILPRWLSITEACTYAGMSDKTLIRYVKDGAIYATRKGGKWYVDRQSIDSFMLSDNVFVEETVARLKGVGI